MQFSWFTCGVLRELPLPYSAVQAGT